MLYQDDFDHTNWTTWNQWGNDSEIKVKDGLLIINGNEARAPSVHRAGSLQPNQAILALIKYSPGTGFQLKTITENSQNSDYFSWGIVKDPNGSISWMKEEKGGDPSGWKSGSLQGILKPANDQWLYVMLRIMGSDEVRVQVCDKYITDKCLEASLPIDDSWLDGQVGFQLLSTEGTVMMDSYQEIEFGSDTSTNVPNPTLTLNSVVDNSSWQRGKLLNKTDFENGSANEWETNGIFDIIRIDDGNYVWQITNNGEASLSLPASTNDYVVETKVMQVSGEPSLIMIFIRIKNDGACQQDYRTYIDTSSDWLTLAEAGNRGTYCDELQNKFRSAIQTSLENGIWYKLRIEAKGSEIRVYLDDSLMLQSKSDSLNSNLIRLASWGENRQNVFYFDDINIWELTP